MTDSDPDDDCATWIDISYQVNGQKYDDSYNAWSFTRDNPEQVTVFYNPQAPDQEQVGSFTNLWFWPFFFLLISLFFLALAAGQAHVNRLLVQKEAEWAGMQMIH